MAFQTCARNCFRETFLKTKPVLLEPVMKIEIEVPAQYQGPVTGELTSRRGLIVIDRGQRQPSATIEAEVPLAETFGYSTDLRSMTQGQGTFTMEFCQVPPRAGQHPGRDRRREEETTRRRQVELTGTTNILARMADALSNSRRKIPCGCFFWVLILPSSFCLHPYPSWWCRERVLCSAASSASMPIESHQQLMLPGNVWMRLLAEERQRSARLEHGLVDFFQSAEALAMCGAGQLVQRNQFAGPCSSARSTRTSTSRFPRPSGSTAWDAPPPPSAMSILGSSCATSTPSTGAGRQSQEDGLDCQNQRPSATTPRPGRPTCPGMRDPAMMDRTEGNSPGPSPAGDRTARRASREFESLMTDTNPSPRPRKKRRWPKLLAGMLVVPIALIAAIPWGLATPPGQRWLLRGANRGLAPGGGRIAWTTLRVSWFAPTRPPASSSATPRAMR